ncbi:hypothetical protein M9H77_07304 [Catharanthus roseus]|uniref:Uncharacterized protein n=1 Tax=Catharanthus roseus TaxID=4058 RepID=A0ACC0BUJ2_CATRO|nr:hypothetical protein M9H77_07304 [Catharanthus roseus]
MAQSVYVDTASCSAVGFGRLVESQEGLKTEVDPMADLISLGRSGAQQATEVLGQEIFNQISPGGICLCFIFPNSNRLCFIVELISLPYSAAIDLVARLGVSQT